MDDHALRALARRFGAVEAKPRTFVGRPGTEYTLGRWGEFWIADGLPTEAVLEFIESVLEEETRAAFGDRRDDLSRLGELVDDLPL